jgi:dihydroorotase
VDGYAKKDSRTANYRAGDNVYDLIIRDGTIVRSSGRLVADIAIEDGKVVYVGGNPAGGAKEEISGIGRFVMPGVIDANVYCRDAKNPSKKTWTDGSREALIGGVTTVLAMPESDDPSVDEKSIREKLSNAGSESAVNFGVWAGVNASNLKDVGALWDAGLICGTKVLMGDSGGSSALDPDVLRDVFAKTKGLLGVHAEDQAVLNTARSQNEGSINPVHNDLRPPEAAIRGVEALIELVKESGRSVHLCHVSTAGELTALDPYRDDLPITCEAAPQHLFLSIENTGNQGNLIKADPPIRTELDRRAMLAAVKRGRIDAFASSHSPYALDAKKQDYWSVPSGIPGVGAMLPLLMGALKNGKINLETLVAMCCENPARIFNLEGKGHIEEGADADLLLFREGDTTKLTADMLGPHCGWSPYIGREVGVAPKLVVVNGVVAARDGVLADKLPAGKPVTYSGR